MDYTLTLRDLADDLARLPDAAVVGICHSVHACWGARALLRKYGRPFTCVNSAAWTSDGGDIQYVEIAPGVEEVLDAFDALDTRRPGCAVDMLPQTKACVVGILQAAYTECSGCQGGWCDGCVPPTDLLFVES